MSETIAQTITRLTAFIQEKAPSVDVSPGSVFNELIVGLEGQIQNQVYNDISAISTEQAVSDALNSITDTYSSVIDKLASNYDVYRNQGGYSTGTLKVYVTANSNYTISAGVTFVQPNLNYTYTNLTQLSVYPTSSESSPKLVAENGLYYFTLQVQASIIGVKSTIGNGTLFALATANQIPNFVKAIAAGAFSPGLDIETDKLLIARFRNGLGTKNLLSANSITHQLANTYPGFQSVHLADTLSPVNIRSTTNPLAIKIPSCVDVYVKNGIVIPTVQTNVVGTYVAATGASGDLQAVAEHWDLYIPATLIPGFYRITHVTIVDPAVTDIVYQKFQTVYGHDQNAANLIPNPAAARYSAHQNAVVRVFHPNTGDSSALTFQITAIAPPNIVDIQATFSDPDNRIPCADYLVKGIVPCMVSLSLAIVKNNIADVVDMTALQGDIFSYINGLKVGESIAVSQIVKLCHQHNIARVDLPIVLNGRILAPYKSVNEVVDHEVVIAGSDYLEIPDIPSKGITRQNTMFFLNYFDDNGMSNINISIR
jgi:hypothetical protein